MLDAGTQLSCSCAFMQIYGNASPATKNCAASHYGYWNPSDLSRTLKRIFARAMFFTEEDEATRTSSPPRTSASCCCLDLHLWTLHLGVTIQNADVLPEQIIPWWPRQWPWWCRWRWSSQRCRWWPWRSQQRRYRYEVTSRFIPCCANRACRHLQAHQQQKMLPLSRKSLMMLYDRIPINML